MQLLSLYATPRRVKMFIYGDGVKYEEENSKNYTKSLFNAITKNHCCFWYHMRALSSLGYGSLPFSKKWLSIIQKYRVHLLEASTTQSKTGSKTGFLSHPHDLFFIIFILSSHRFTYFNNVKNWHGNTRSMAKNWGQFSFFRRSSPSGETGNSLSVWWIHLHIYPSTCAPAGFEPRTCDFRVRRLSHSANGAPHPHDLEEGTWPGEPDWV